MSAVLGLYLVVALLVGAVSLAHAEGPREEQRHERVEERREPERRLETPWRFERGLGWRFEHRPGVWSPHYVWWWVDQRVILLPAPTVTAVQYSNGRYELRGDGISVPYYWVWIAALPPVIPPPPPVVAPPPPPAAVSPPAGSVPPPPPPPPG